MHKVLGLWLLFQLAHGTSPEKISQMTMVFQETQKFGKDSGGLSDTTLELLLSVPFSLQSSGLSDQFSSMLARKWQLLLDKTLPLDAYSDALDAALTASIDS